MDDLWESDDLIYDALWTATNGQDTSELPDDMIEGIKEWAFESIDDRSEEDCYLPIYATLDEIIEATDELEEKCEEHNERMYNELCDVVRGCVLQLESEKEEQA